MRTESERNEDTSAIRNDCQENITEGINGVFSTLGEFRDDKLDSYIDNDIIKSSIEAALRMIKGYKKHIHYFAISHVNDDYIITCLLQGEKKTKLRQGNYRAYSYNCNHPESSTFEDITVKADWTEKLIRQ